MDQATQPRIIGHGLRPVADNVWIVDAGRINAAGLPLPVRMTVIRLSSGDLLLHSPTRFSHALREELEQLGPIKYLLAPNVAHWMFLPDWQAALPNAKVYAAPGLADRSQVRRSGLRIDRELTDVTPDEWSEDLQLVLVTAPMFTEVAVFHRPSRTLVLTDLVQNLAPEGLGIPSRAAAHLLGITAPDGKAPAYLRLLLRLGGRAVQLAAARLIALAPERVIFAHGRWFETGGTQQLRHSLGWLLDGSPEARRLMRDLRGKRVVITGASSGIGRATALALAREGASLVLAARREDVLKDVAAECETFGGRAVAVGTDVTNADAVKQLAERAVQTFGGIDVWINNAGTGVFGAYQDADIALHRKTIEVNLLGTMNGAYAALPVFLRQRRGTLINNISLGGWAPTPFAAAYTASKFGLRGFSASLRQELAAHRDIHVCSVFPAMVDTPGFVHGANVSGRNLDPGPLLYRPEDVAETFVQLIRAPHDEVAVGWPARLGQISYALARWPTERFMSTAFRFLLSRAKIAPRSSGAVLAPIPAGTSVSGGWLARKKLPAAGQLSKIGLAVGIGGMALLLATRSRAARPSPRKRSHR
ncbi:Putative Short-chain dehydrogenase/reductase (modular) [Bradyrhizobium sp. ORS 285]|uniref:SDR family oxidoreductase n=1 Tax=Bradyrhizobium sp. ORS 285 TaxID=115808 RepID=UPI000240AB4A|nr:SDR family oxidoreductase [Bradyrhizobium sp. ORS 285]CCD85276.1 putative Short-chain dehydrogenase/reductase (modular) [Bradyrhizobium sp. ORS 285]SMX57473.1 Putative Short-chain dehydrogenase/reductase (modular) [Bradyrhizobium sp. ORS 285]